MRIFGGYGYGYKRVFGMNKFILGDVGERSLYADLGGHAGFSGLVKNDKHIVLVTDQTAVLSS